MKLAIIEPLGISEAQANDLQKKYLPSDVEMVYYNTPAANDAEKSQRINGADCVMLANTPFKETVVAGSDKLKFIFLARRLLPLRWGMNGGSPNLRKQLTANKWHICYN